MRATSARREPAKHRKTLLAKAPHPGVAFAIREVEKARLRRGREGGRRHILFWDEKILFWDEKMHTRPHLLVRAAVTRASNATLLHGR